MNTTILSEIICNRRIWIGITDEKVIKDALSKSLIESNHNILNFIEHSFYPQGYTAIWLLAESHLALHTFPEKEVSYIELSSCNCNLVEVFMNQIQKYPFQFLSITN